jgi:hypothetical protein
MTSVLSPMNSRVLNAWILRLSGAVEILAFFAVVLWLFDVSVTVHESGLVAKA